MDLAGLCSPLTLNSLELQDIRNVRDASQTAAARLVEHARIASLAFPSRGAGTGLTARQAKALLVVYADGNSTIGQIGHAVGLHPSTLDGVLDHLAEIGLLEFVADPRDKRRRVVGLTDAGRQEARAFTNKVVQRLRDKGARFDYE